MTATAQGEFIVIAPGREYGASSEAAMWMNAGGNPMGDHNPGNWIQSWRPTYCRRRVRPS
ncbi:hypothetical protein ACGFK1_29085 [Mycobacterium sp. NPDC048908]|uniref:hypothetical protein n=1 Tax=Mycobacterium sp. NPDC048908 TaxID=3364292 RepID=UPI0037200E7F